MRDHRRRKLTAVIEPGEDGWFVAHCPELPGCVSQGRTRKEAKPNLREAMQGYLEVMDEDQTERKQPSHRRGL